MVFSCLNEPPYHRNYHLIQLTEDTTLRQHRLELLAIYFLEKLVISRKRRLLNNLFNNTFLILPLLLEHFSLSPFIHLSFTPFSNFVLYGIDPFSYLITIYSSQMNFFRLLSFENSLTNDLDTEQVCLAVFRIVLLNLKL